MGCGAVIGLGMAAIAPAAGDELVLRPAAGVLRSACRPRDALRVSRDRVTGHRHTVVFWIVVWLIVTLLLSVLGHGRRRVRGPAAGPARHRDRCYLLLFAVGTTLIVWSGLHVVINVVTTTSFAAVFFRLYRRLGSPTGTGCRATRPGADRTDRRGTSPADQEDDWPLAVLGGHGPGHGHRRLRDSQRAHAPTSAKSSRIAARQLCAGEHDGRSAQSHRRSRRTGWKSTCRSRPTVKSWSSTTATS